MPLDYSSFTYSYGYDGANFQKLLGSFQRFGFYKVWRECSLCQINVDRAIIRILTRRVCIKCWHMKDTCYFVQQVYIPSIMIGFQWFNKIDIWLDSSISSSNGLVNFKDIHCHVLVRGDRKTIQELERVHHWRYITNQYLNDHYLIKVPNVRNLNHVHKIVLF